MNGKVAGEDFLSLSLFISVQPNLCEPSFYFGLASFSAKWDTHSFQYADLVLLMLHHALTSTLPAFVIWIPHIRAGGSCYRLKFVAIAPKTRQSCIAISHMLALVMWLWSTNHTWRLILSERQSCFHQICCRCLDCIDFDILSTSLRSLE